MMDISDGIASDLNHILKSSNKSAVVELNTIPTSQLLQEIAKQENWNLASLATSGGEDYELLFTVQADAFEEINKAFKKEFDKPIYAIGKISIAAFLVFFLGALAAFFGGATGSPMLTVSEERKDNKEIILSADGFNHFE
jgi:thiamine-monophosphate kinase